MAYRLFLVEDHPVLRHSHVSIIQHTPGLELCGEAASGEEALEKIAGTDANLVLVDISLPGMSGLDLIQHLADTQPTLPVLIVSGHERELYMKSYPGSGGSNVKGYIMKHQGPTALLEEIHRILREHSARETC